MFMESWMPAIFSPQHRLLHASFVFFIIPYLYSYLNEQHRMASYSVEQAMSFAWDRAITKPGAPFRKAVVGFNCNVDLIVPGTHVIDSLNTTCEKGKDNEWIESVSDLHETFIHFFQRGAPAERYMSSEESFNTVVRLAETSGRAQYHIGGNAALMAERIASGFPSTEGVEYIAPLVKLSKAVTKESDNVFYVGSYIYHALLPY